MKQILFLSFLLLIVLSGCGMQEREKLVKNKEKELARKEQELITREEALRLKEESLAKKQQKLDSTQLDSAFYNPSITGSWNVRMVCVETNCTGSAIGDTKNEIWDISYQNDRVIAKAMTDNTVVRTYEGTYNNNLLELRDNIEVSPNTPATEIVVRLTLLNNTLEGQRQIIRSGDCRIVYSMQLDKGNNVILLN
ncbi:hypothetical protein HUW51_12895 [Adhaeribacter swui]|uniref:Lipoprotein n=1 Tax=Adhaeribacter swui TaxID=2086471 RepID=A0A7G7G8U0_9BACT|nr:hypothetical protein [Adhaeribacter swui]QNF33574.1 hypothetical protein HUW51_12895 [Adhaeribacter swui]